MAWQERASLAFMVLGSVGAALTAYATLKTLGIAKRTAAVAGPALADPKCTRDRSPAGSPIRVQLAVMPQDQDRWRIKRVVPWPPFRRLVSEIASRDIPDGAGGMNSRITPAKWVRYLVYDPPKESVGFFVSSIGPRRLRLVVTLALRADDRITSRRVTTIKAHD